MSFLSVVCVQDFALHSIKPLLIHEVCQKGELEFAPILLDMVLDMCGKGAEPLFCGCCKA